MHCRMGRGPAGARADAHRARPTARRRGRHDRAAPARIGGARRADAGAWTGETDIFITPGFRFRVVDLLLTNFHLPRSTLFMLVAAFAGLERMKAAYAARRRRAIPLLFLRRLLSVAAMSLVPSSFSGTDGAGPPRPPHDRARHGRDAGLHAGRHRRHGEGDAAAVGRRDRRGDRAGQHLPPDAAAGRRARRGARRPAQVHELAQADPHRLGRLPGDVAQGAAQARSRRRHLPLAGRRPPASPDARALDRDPASARLRHRHVVRRMHDLAGRGSRRPPHSMRLSMRWAERGRRAFERSAGLRPVRHRAGQHLSGAARGKRAGADATSASTATRSAAWRSAKARR